MSMFGRKKRARRIDTFDVNENKTLSEHVEQLKTQTFSSYTLFY